MQNKKVLLTILSSFILLAALPLMSAATAITSPIASTNYTGTMNVTVTTAVIDTGNVTCWYNATGTPTGGSLLAIIQNTSVGQTLFTNPIVDISSITDSVNYSIVCGADNGANTTYENSTAVIYVGIDNTDPLATITLSRPSVGTGNTLDITWTSSDATSGLTSTLVTFTSPNTDNCPVQTWSTASGTDTLSGSEETGCTGENTVTVLATDTAGNTKTATVTFNVDEAGMASTGANTLGGSEISGFQITDFSIFGDNGKLGNTNIPANLVAWIVIAIIVYFLFFNKKKRK